MSFHITIGYLDGEVTDVTATWMTSNETDKHFPLGDVYRFANEPGGRAWRILQRGKMVSKSTGFYAQLLPIKAEDVPEIVRMVALMRE